MARIVFCALALLCLLAASEPEELVARAVQHIGGPGPRLHLVESFASDAEMDHIISKAFPLQKPQDQETETGIVTELPLGDDPMLVGVFDRMRSLLPNLAPKVGGGQSLDTFRVRRYLPDGIGLKGGDYHPPHTDWFVPNQGDHTHVLIVTMILYLTSPEKGGTTFFKHGLGGKGYHFQPVRGNLAVWWSCKRDGSQDWLSDHSSEPLKKGVKWNAARFFYADTKLCNEDVQDTIMVPKAANFNVPMKSSFDVMFNTTFPAGVTVTERGTSTVHEVHGGRKYDVDEDDKVAERDALIAQALEEMVQARSEL